MQMMQILEIFAIASFQFIAAFILFYVWTASTASLPNNAFI